MRFLTSLHLILFVLVGNTIMAQDYSSYEARVFSEEGQQLPYRILFPKDYQESQEYPLILLLHGAGERGNDNKSQLVHGADLFLRKDIREKHKAIVVFPQCAVGSSWARANVTGSGGNREFEFYKDADPTVDMTLLEGLLKRLKKVLPIDRDRIYVGGLSMGGMGTFEIVRRNPKVFAAAFPICGGANPLIVKKLRHLDWWVFHGQADQVVPEKCSAVMVNAMGNRGINVKYTKYPGVGHNSWENAFSELELLTWLFSKSR